MSDCLFVSDLHLDPARPAATRAFLRLLEAEARDVATLYILGDLFEFWIGDDADDDIANSVLAALLRYTTAGHNCRVMRGNRDFLLGPGFEQRSGAKLLRDPEVIEVAGERTLITHGDLLCTDDHAYQRYRRRVNNATAQKIFLALPRRWRKGAGDIGRKRSRRHTARQSAAIMDVNQGSVSASLREHRCSRIIHGHTHRPGTHQLEVDGRPCTRIVLGDWYEQSSVLFSPQGGPLELRSGAFTN